MQVILLRILIFPSRYRRPFFPTVNGGSVNPRFAMVFRVPHPACLSPEGSPEGSLEGRINGSSRRAPGRPSSPIRHSEPAVGAVFAPTLLPAGEESLLSLLHRQHCHPERSGRVYCSAALRAKVMGIRSFRALTKLAARPRSFGLGKCRHSERSVPKFLSSEIGFAISVGTRSRGISLRFWRGHPPIGISLGL